MRMQTMPLCLLLFLTVSLHATNRPSSPYEFIDIYSGIAIQEMERSGIPASITLAQGIMESMFGTSELAINSNNLFGIKCKKNWAGPTYQLKDDDKDSLGNLVESCFRAYGSPEESFFDHTDFLINNNNYKPLFDYGRTDYVNWANGLQKCGYATNPAYATQLISTIERFGLAVYDAQGAVVPKFIPSPNNEANINWAFPDEEPRMPPVYDIPLDYKPDETASFGLPQDEGIGSNEPYEAADMPVGQAPVTRPTAEPAEVVPAREVAVVHKKRIVKEEDTEDYLFDLQPQEVIDFGTKGVILVIDPRQ